MFSWVPISSYPKLLLLLGPANRNYSIISAGNQFWRRWNGVCVLLYAVTELLGCRTHRCRRWLNDANGKILRFLLPSVITPSPHFSETQFHVFFSKKMCVSYLGGCQVDTVIGGRWMSSGRMTRFSRTVIFTVRMELLIDTHKDTLIRSAMYDAELQS